jgi:hypothetical protein
MDESQDLRDDFFRVVELIARPNAAWFIAYGKGQETNNFFKDETHPSPWLKEFLENSETNHLKRSFRNSTKAFLLAQGFWEKFPELGAAKEWLRDKFHQNPISENQFELDLEIPQTKNDLRVELLPAGNKRRSFVKNIILGAIEDARRANRGEDLLVAVLAPSMKKADENDEPVNSGYELVREVLEEVGDGGGHGVDVAGRARHRLGDHVALRVIDAGGQIARLARDGAEGGAEQGLRLLLNHRDQAVPHDLRADGGECGLAHRVRSRTM